MKLYDISRELFSCPVYPGDTAPRAVRVKSIARGSEVNLSDLHMCAHNGTHMDAPLHFLHKADSISDMALARCVGQADVVTFSGYFDEDSCDDIPVGCRRLLLRSDTIMTAAGADAIVRAGIVLVGVESQTIGDRQSSAAVHRALLSARVAILEGIDLSRVPDGRYFLSAAPLKGEGLDGAPVRAFLIGE